MSQRLGILAKVSLSIGLIVFLLTRLDLVALGNQFTRANPFWLLLALLLYFLALVLGVLKWHLLIRAQHLPVSFRNSATCAFTGLFLGNVLPSNVGGDIVRATMLARAGSTVEAAVISVLVDRLMGLVAFFATAVVSAILAVMFLTSSTAIETLALATLIGATVITLVSALVFSRRLARCIAPFFEHGVFARLRPRALRLYHAIQVYRHAYGVLVVNVALAVTIIVIATLVWYLVALALGIDVPLIYFFLFNPLIGFVLLIPISINGLGPKEATTIFFFGLVGVPSESAFAMSLMFHAIIVLTSLPGGVAWWQQQPQLRDAESMRLASLENDSR